MPMSMALSVEVLMVSRRVAPPSDPIGLPPIASASTAAVAEFAEPGRDTVFVKRALRPGEAVIDLGSGLGIDSFIAAAAVGELGRVTGIDIAEKEEESLHFTLQAEHATAIRCQQRRWRG